MPIVKEKRWGRDRRQRRESIPHDFKERRRDERRQTTIREISFTEWASHFARYTQGEMPLALIKEQGEQG